MLALGFPLARRGPSRHPQTECRQPTRILEPFLQNRQPRQGHIPPRVDVVDDLEDFFGNVGAHGRLSFRFARLLPRPLFLSSRLTALLTYFVLFRLSFPKLAKRFGSAGIRAK